MVLGERSTRIAVDRPHSTRTCSPGPFVSLGGFREAPGKLCSTEMMTPSVALDDGRNTGEDATGKHLQRSDFIQYPCQRRLLPVTVDYRMN